MLVWSEVTDHNSEFSISLYQKVHTAFNFDDCKTLYISHISSSTMLYVLCWGSSWQMDCLYSGVWFFASETISVFDKGWTTNIYFQKISIHEMVGLRLQIHSRFYLMSSINTPYRPATSTSYLAHFVFSTLYKLITIYTYVHVDVSSHLSDI